MAERHHYTTNGLVGGGSLTAWRDYMSTVYYELDILPTDRPEISGELTEAHFEFIGVSNFKADAQKVVRRKSAAQRDPSENFVFLFPIRGAFAFEQNGRSASCTVGQLALLNSAEGYEVTVRDRSENVTLKIPCDALRERLPRLDDICGRPRAANPFLVPVVAQLGAQLLKFDSGSRAGELQRSLIDLVCLMMEGTPAGVAQLRERRALADIMFERVEAHLRTHYCDPDLSPAKVANALRISSRYLHRLFQMHERTFGEAIMEIRLIEARNLLQAARSSGRKVPMGEISMKCGFNSQSHFTTRFRERFGITPGRA